MYNYYNYFNEVVENERVDKDGKSPRLKNQQTNKKVEKHPRCSVAIDVVDPVYHHMDPISVSLQERVKFGGHITSVTKKPFHKIPFYYMLSEKNACEHISKRAILSKEIE